MSDQHPGMSSPFQIFMKEAPDHAQAWMETVRVLDSAGVLDKKTEELVYLAVFAALRLAASRSDGQASGSFARRSYQRDPDWTARCRSGCHASFAWSGRSL